VHAFLEMYKLLVRLHLVCAALVWNPHLILKMLGCFPWGIRPGMLATRSICNAPTWEQEVILISMYTLQN